MIENMLTMHKLWRYGMGPDAQPHGLMPQIVASYLEYCCRKDGRIWWEVDTIRELSELELERQRG